MRCGEPGHNRYIVSYIRVALRTESLSTPLVGFVGWFEERSFFSLPLVGKPTFLVTLTSNSGQHSYHTEEEDLGLGWCSAFTDNLDYVTAICGRRNKDTKFSLLNEMSSISLVLSEGKIT